MKSLCLADCARCGQHPAPLLGGEPVCVECLMTEGSTPPRAARIKSPPPSAPAPALSREERLRALKLRFVPGRAGAALVQSEADAERQAALAKLGRAALAKLSAEWAARAGAEVRS